MPFYKYLKQKLHHGWTSTFKGTASNGTLPVALVSVHTKRRGSDVSELLRGITVDQPVQTSIHGPSESNPQIQKEVEGTEDGAIWKITQVDVDFENPGRQAEEGSVGGVKREAPKLPDAGGGREAGSGISMSDDSWWGIATAPERPGCARRIFSDGGGSRELTGESGKRA